MKSLLSRLKRGYFLLGLLFSFSSLSAVPIHFAVDLSYQMVLGNFNPQTDFVDLAGNFNTWGTNPSVVLSDLDQDSIYEIELNGFNVGQEIQFKFRINGQWNGLEEFPGGGPNRTYTPISSTDSISVWYSDLELPSGPPQAAFSVAAATIQVGAAAAFYDISSGLVTEWEWYFPGGVPETSLLQNPSVLYTQPGTYDVRLIAKHNGVEDTLWMWDFVTVEARDLSQLDWWNETVFYEIFVRSFYDSDGDGIGDFQGLTQQLDYLNDGDSSTTEDLGIEGIWLMPISPSPSYHGYDVTDYRGINPDYGTMQDFQAFLDAAHARGIKVIVDYVINHSSTQHPWFIDSRNNQNGKRDFYRWRSTAPGYNGPWGQNVWHNGGAGQLYYGLFWGGMPDLNYETAAVHDSIWATASFWLDDIGVDGFRLDAIKYIYEDGADLENLASTYQFWKDFEAHTEQVQTHSLNVGEAWTSTPTVVKYVENGGLDICFEFDLAENILAAAQSGDASGLRGKMDEVYGVYPHLQWGSFLTNHDQNRIFSILNENIDQNKTAAAILLTLPGVPFLYYGEEIGMTGVKPDEDIRRPMQWTAGSNAGFSTVSPWNNLNNNYQQYNVATLENNPASLLHFYRNLIQLRNAVPSLQTGDYRGLPSNDNAVFAFLRHGASDTSLVVINTSGQQILAPQLNMAGTAFAPGAYQWQDRWQNQLQALNIDLSEQLELDTLAPYAVHIFAAQGGQVVGNTASIEQDIFAVLPYPNPAQESLFLHFSETVHAAFEVHIYDLMGREVFSQDAFRPHSKQGIPVSGLAPGKYIVHLSDGARALAIRFVKE